MLRFLFWNLGGRPLCRAVREIALSRDVDVVLLVESPATESDTVYELNSGAESRYRVAPGDCPRIKAFCRFRADSFVPVYESDRWSIRRLVLPGRIEILLAAVHGISKLHADAESQGHECIVLADQIRAVEERVGHENTLLIGDLNMNPFESAVVSAVGLHAAMTRTIARRGSRTVQGRTYPFFYNPMWGHLGDLAESPPGTYYKSESRHKAYFWHMFDQVLLRPGLLRYFDHRSLEIVSTLVPGDLDSSLLTPRGTPNRAVGSDHLPIVVGLEV